MEAMISSTHAKNIYHVRINSNLDKTLQEKVAVLMSKNMIPVGITSTEANTEIRDVSVDTLIHIVEDLSRIH